MHTRRAFLYSSIAAAAPSLAWAAKLKPAYKGVLLGVQSYSFRDRNLDAAIAATQQIGIGTVELWSGHAEPSEQLRKQREELRKFRLETPLKHWEGIRKKLGAAGIDLHAYNYPFRDDFTDAEIARGFDMAKALGVRIITASSNVTTARRVDPFAKKAKIKVAMHNHSRVAPNEFATPDDFEQAMKGMSEFITINLDIGHFIAAGFDPVDYLKKNHARIPCIHIKDRKKNQGPNTPFGEGDTPIKEVLLLLKEKKLKIPANIEYEYKGADTVAEVRRSFEYMRKCLD